MPRLRVRELFGLDRLRARNDIAEWGYPRDIHEQELLTGHWFAAGLGDVLGERRGVFWLVQENQREPGDFSVHAAALPGSLLGLRIAEWSRILLVIGDLLGAKRFVIGPMPQAPLVRVLSRLGWQEQSSQWYLSLGG